MKLKKKLLALLLVLCLGCLALTACGTAAEPPGKSQVEEPPYVMGPVPVYPTNAKGESYGIAANNFVYDPDLIAAIGEDGVEGYIREKEANPFEPKSPEEALRWQEEYRAQGGFHYINLYDKEGNVIGKFKVGDGANYGVEYVEGQSYPPDN